MKKLRSIKTEPLLIKAGSPSLKLGIPGTSPDVDCRVIDEGIYQRMRRAMILLEELEINMKGTII